MSVNFCPQCGTEVGEGDRYCSNCGDPVSTDEPTEPVPEKERPLWRVSELKRIVGSERFRLGGLVLFVLIALFSFAPVVRNQATIAEVQTFIVGFVGSWIFFYLDLRTEYDDNGKVVGWALFGFLLFIVAVPLYTAWRVAKVLIGPSTDTTPYFKASVSLAFFALVIFLLIGMFSSNDTTSPTSTVIAFAFVLSLALSGIAMFLDLNTDRHWTRAIVWPIAGLFASFVVLPYYIYKRRQSLVSEEPDSTDVETDVA